MQTILLKSKYLKFYIEFFLCETFKARFILQTINMTAYLNYNALPAETEHPNRK